MADAKSKTAYVRCSPELAVRVKAEAAARDLGERFLVDRALTDLLDNLVPVEEFSLMRPREKNDET